MRHDYGEETIKAKAPRMYCVFIGGNTHTCIYFSTSNSCILSTPPSLSLQPEYKAMVELHNKYSAQGFGTSPKLSYFPISIPLEYDFTSYSQKHTHTDIIAFPCNQFGYQEKGCEVDIKEFAKKKGFNGTMMSKISVVCYSFVCALISVLRGCRKKVLRRAMR